MLAFVEGRADVLVATTIIENGLDIPRANTMIVNRADRFGLAQLYQLRGRVGRSDRRAYAYLLVPPDTVLSEIARKRLAAIQEFSELGAGFRIAALDLELRGAGNLLGGEQSGHIQAVGLDLYVKLLEQTILELQAASRRTRRRARRSTCGVDLRHPARLRAGDAPAPDALQAREPAARRGRGRGAARRDPRPLRPAARARCWGLLRYAGLRLRAEALGLVQVDAAGGALTLRFAASTRFSPSGSCAGAARAAPARASCPTGPARAAPRRGPARRARRACSDARLAPALAYDRL